MKPRHFWRRKFIVMQQKRDFLAKMEIFWQFSKFQEIQNFRNFKCITVDLMTIDADCLLLVYK